MKQTLDTQEARTARILELTDWNDGDYERFATSPVESQLRLIAANEVPETHAIDWNAPITPADNAAWDATLAAAAADVANCERWA